MSAAAHLTMLWPSVGLLIRQGIGSAKAVKDCPLAPPPSISSTSSTARDIGSFDHNRAKGRKPMARTTGLEQSCDLALGHLHPATAIGSVPGAAARPSNLLLSKVLTR